MATVLILQYQKGSDLFTSVLRPTFGVRPNFGLWSTVLEPHSFGTPQFWKRWN